MRRLLASGIFHLFVVYVVWGSTYLAIRVAVREGSGLGPFWLGASRTLLAAVLLLAFVALRRRRLKPSRPELVVLVTSGVLMWVGGNGGVNWAEQRLDSGLVALIIGSMPLWVALMESLLDRRLPSLLLASSLVIGFVGLVVLSLPLLRSGISGDAASVAAVLVAAVSWGAGSLLLRRRPPALDTTAVAGVQQLAGGVGFALFALAVAEPLPTPSSAAVVAFAYLTLFGSIIAIRSYVRALQLLPTSLVMTYTYVNPVIALLLGWILLDETITGTTIAGMALILAGVIGAFRDRTRRMAMAAPQPATEAPEERRAAA